NIPSDEASDEERLKTLGSLWDAIGCARPSAEHIDSFAVQQGIRIGADAENCRYSLRRLLTRINSAIIELHERGLEDPRRVFRRSDFGDGCITLANEPGNLYGVLSYLPSGHWGLELVPIDDAVLVPGWGPSLLLGKSSQGYFRAAQVANSTRE